MVEFQSSCLQSFLSPGEELLSFWLELVEALSFIDLDNESLPQLCFNQYRENTSQCCAELSEPHALV